MPSTRKIREAVIVESQRTGLAKSFRGSFNQTRPDDKAAHCVKAVLAKVPQLDPKEIDDPGRRSDIGEGRALRRVVLPIGQTDVLSCPKCGGRMVVISTIDDPAVINSAQPREQGQAVDAGRLDQFDG